VHAPVIKRRSDGAEGWFYLGVVLCLDVCGRMEVREELDVGHFLIDDSNEALSL
jgi:hypothetical protein